MRLVAFMIAVIFLTRGVAAEDQTTQQDFWDKADIETRRLLPSAFPNLPSPVSAYLLKRGCTIPQPFHSKSKQNVIRGEFKRADQIDWAVLCSRERHSSILVFWSGSVDLISEIGNSPDKSWLQGIGSGEIGFSRVISVVGDKFIIEHHEAYGGPSPPEIDHEAIDEAFIEKGSVVYYWHNEEWLELSGAD